MYKKLIKLANHLDQLGLYKEASEIDSIIKSIAQDEPMETETQDPGIVDVKERVKSAFMANPDNVSKVLSTRNPGPNAQGSVFAEPQTPETLMNANWEEYSHPDVKPPATAFRAKIPGAVGVIELGKIDPSTPVVLVDGHETGFLAPVVKASREANSEYTTLLLGPINNEGLEGVWTFFPGDPIMPSELKVEDVPSDQRNISAGDAIGMGFQYAKVGG